MRWPNGWKDVAPASTGRMALLGLACLAGGMFIKLTWELKEDAELSSLDNTMLMFIGKLRIPMLNGPAVELTALGSITVVLIVTVIVLSILVLKKDRRGMLYVVTGVIGTGVWTELLKDFISRERPTVVSRLVEVSGYSYPSGHALTATSFYVILMFLVWRHFPSPGSRILLSILTIMLIGGVCFSRLYLGVHYPSDVASGILLGASWAFLLTAYFSFRFSDTKIKKSL